jgi:tripartite-type tricarboxylate transporter receptor subunit TctC
MRLAVAVGPADCLGARKLTGIRCFDPAKTGRTKRGNALKLPRRRLLVLAGAAVAAPAVSRLAWAQAYPARPIRWVVGFAPGGSTDILARVLGPWLSERLGQPIVIENRPGGGSNIATESVVNAPPDGYTLLMISPAHAVNTTLYSKLNYVFLRDIAPVAGISREANVMVVNPSFPAKTVPEFIAYARANPAKINVASSGNGTSVHVAGELFNMMTGIKMLHVPYRGAGPAITDLLGGQVHVMFAAMPSAIEHVRAGRLRALAVTTAARSPVLPDVPSVGEFVPGYEASSWYGIGVPKGTPPEVIDTLNKAVNAALADPKLKSRIGDLGGTMLAGSPAAFGMLIADETEKWAKVVKFSGARAD